MGTPPVRVSSSASFTDAAAALSVVNPDDYVSNKPTLSFSTKFVLSALVGGAALHYLAAPLASIVATHPLLGVLAVACLVALALLAIRPNATHYQHAASLEGRVFVVTGANKGLGLSTSIQLARLGARVVLACRNVVRAQAAVQEILRQVPGAQVEYSKCDLSSFASIRRCVSSWRDRRLKIDYLVNNAGAMLAPSTTEDGHDVTWQTNFIGPALLTRLVVETNVLHAKGRVVFVSSLMHYYGHVKLNELGSTSSHGQASELTTATPQLLSSTDTYCNTKLAQVMYARHLQRTPSFASTGRTTASLNPGIIESDFFLHFIPGWCRDVCAALGIFKMFSVTPEVAACTVVHACLCPAYANAGGLYMDNCKPKLPSQQARDPAECEALFHHTMEVTEPGTFAASWKNHAPKACNTHISNSSNSSNYNNTGTGKTHHRTTSRGSTQPANTLAARADFMRHATSRPLSV